MGGVARDVHDEPATRGEQRNCELDERNGSTGVDREDAAEALDVERHQRTHTAKLRGVVHQHVEAAELTRGVDPSTPNRGIGHVSGNRDHMRAMLRARARGEPIASAVA